MSQRAYFIDRLRTVMTFIVLFAHVWMTYGAAGMWFYREVGNSRAIFSVLGSLYCLTNEAFLMGLFFLLAGYFTPASYDRKGAVKFLWDRALRLGIPLLLFSLLLAPLTVAMVAAAYGPGFWPSLALLWKDKEFINGPMWFAEALLIMSVGYAVWRLLKDAKTSSPSRSTERRLTHPPSSVRWLLSALLVGSVAFVVRIWAPVDTRFFGFWIGYFPSYIFLFAVGVAAWRNRWLESLTWRQAQPWVIVACVTWPVLPAVAIVGKLHGHLPYFAGAMTPSSLLYAMWEPLVAWGAIAGAILWFRTKHNHASRLQDWLGRRAYAVYFLHPPVLVAVSLLLRHWHSPVPVRAAVAGAVGCALTWILADPLVRLPGLSRIF